MTTDDLKLVDESARLAALRRYEVLDTPDEPAFDRITTLVKTIMQVPMCSVSLIDADRQWLKSCIGTTGREMPRGISFCTHTIQERTPMYIPDAKLDPRFADNPIVTGEPFIRSYLGVPLSTPDGYNIGALCAVDCVPREFNASQIEVMKSFAALVVDELELRRIAQTDHLTGANTRRGFTLELEKAIAKNKRGGTSAALIMLDIDHFKKVNDTYGHPAGDQVLRAVSSELRRQLRRTDTLGRLGGEEFGVLLPEMKLPEAADTAERLRASIEALVVENNPPLKVTSSFGIAVLDESFSEPGQWVAATDEALYDAKRSGRNRCCVASGAPTAA